MKYSEAKKLHNEDEVTIKETGVVLTVINTDIRDKYILIECDDGNTYHHRDIK